VAFEGFFILASGSRLAGLPHGNQPAFAAIPTQWNLVFGQLNENKPRLVSLGAPIGNTNTRQAFAN